MSARLWPLALAVAIGMGGTGWVVVGEAVALAATETKATKAHPKARFAVVRVNGKEVLRIAEVADMLPGERAEKAQERLVMVIEPRKDAPFKAIKDVEVEVVMVAGMPVLRLRNQNVITVTVEDAKLNGVPAQALAQRWAADLREGLKTVKDPHGKPLPHGTVTVAVGEIDRPSGGGAGATPPEKKHEPKK